jgi:hypothetical protein
MQEPLQCAVALVLAGLVHRQINGPNQGMRGTLLFFSAVVAAALVRLTWIFVLVPWACVALRGRHWPGRIIAWSVVAAAIPGAFLFAQWVCAPYPNFLSWAVSVGRESPGMAFWSILFRARHALAAWFTWTDARPLESLQHFEVASLILLGAGYCFVPRTDWRPYLFVALHLFLVGAGMILLYDVFEWRDYRVVGPHLLLSLLVLLSGPAPRLIAGTAVLHLAFAGPFVEQFVVLHEARVTCNRRRIEEAQRELSALVDYRPNENAWQNTVLLPTERIDFGLLGLPKGIGITIWLPPGENSGGPRLPLKSRYVVLDELTARSLQRRCHLQPLQRVSWGQLYVNLDSLPERTGAP